MFRFSENDFVIDFYQRLGIECTASDEEIRSAYWKRAKETHPDQNKENEHSYDEFVAVGRAYECLSNPVLRAQYDERLGGATAKFSQAKARAETKTNGDSTYDQDDISRYAAQYAHFKEAYGYTDDMIMDYVEAEKRLRSGTAKFGDLCTAFNFNAGSLRENEPKPNLIPAPQFFLR